MTMHLARGLSTISTKKRKKKALTQKDIERYTIEWRKHNKAMRRANNHSLQYNTVDDYISYVRGEYKAPVKSRGTYTPDTSWRRDEPKIPSAMEEAIKAGTFNRGCSGGTKKETPKYTGDLIVGIATMHKSNAVPVMRGTDQAKEIARMAK
ncbi:hypothetical protein N9C48_01410 [bacterium]|nr:hypothetical protein [bacterium]